MISSSTSTSRIRGTLLMTHSSSLRRQAAISGSAEFLLPSTATVPDSRRPPSILKVAISPPPASRAGTGCSNPIETISSRKRTPYCAHTSCLQRSISARMSAALAPASLTMKLACVGDTRAPPLRAPFSPARSTSAPAEQGMSVRHPLARRIRILEDAAGTRQRQRLRALAVRQRVPGDGTQVLGLAAGRPGSPPRRRPRASGAAGCSRRRTPLPARHVVDLAIAVHQADLHDVLADVAPAEVRVAVNGAADRARRAGPRLQSGQAVRDRPAHESVDGEACIRANRVRSDLLHVSAAQPHHQAVDSRVGDEQVRAAAEHRHGDAVCARDANARRSTRPSCRRSTGTRPARRP